MVNTLSPKAPRMRQARKSIAHLPSLDFRADKENAATDVAELPIVTANAKQTWRKSRSKSAGPGGLDALKESTGNKGEEVKSILKPTISLSPLKKIPPRNASRAGSPRKIGRKTSEASPERAPIRSPAKEDISIDENRFNSPSNGAATRHPSSPSPALVTLRTEEEQQAAASEKERQEMLAHKDARRKSLANRRVSFAPEATLHTWNVVELPEDSTTSSASTNLTRRASSFAESAGSSYSGPRACMPSADNSEPPSTPPEQVEEMQVAASPAHQRDLHQKKRRRSSVIPPMDFNNPNELSSSPCSVDSGVETETQDFETIEESSASSDSDDKDLVEDESMAHLEEDNNTLRSDADSTDSSGKLEAALQQAADQAGTQGNGYDEHGELTSNIASGAVKASKPRMTNGIQRQSVGDLSALLDQDNIKLFSPGSKANVMKEKWEEDGGTMEITQAVGSILPPAEDVVISTDHLRRGSVAGFTRRKSNIARRRSSGDGSSLGGDVTMDLTTAIGLIQQDEPQREIVSADEDEELTMEFTSVVGGVIQSNTKGPDGTLKRPTNFPVQTGDHCQSDFSANGEEDMDFTYAAGSILLPSVAEASQLQENQAKDMDITAAIGVILPEQLTMSSKVEGKALMERELGADQFSPTSPSPHGSAKRPIEAGLLVESPLPAQARKATMASDSGSPSMAVSQARSGARKTAGQRRSLAPTSRQLGPVKNPSTQSKQLTPKPSRRTTPAKTPPPKNNSMRTASPKKLFRAEIRSAKTEVEGTASKIDATNLLFHRDLAAGVTTPSVVLKPGKRRSSGIGIDREGLGSPRVIALLDRRGSIGENAKAFVAQVKGSAGVRFENPRVMEHEIDQERAEERRRESGNGILQGETDDPELDEKDPTTSLRDMIDSLTPQKRKLNGRKSLHVGAAKGLLGKRPAELDEDEEDDEHASPNPLRGQEGSPVKKVKLRAPPSQAATTGRLMRSTRLSFAEIAGNARSSTPSRGLSPSKIDISSKGQSRFKNADAGSPANVTPFDANIDVPEPVLEPAEEDDRIHLQDFLNMTGIRFMELTTTKRRHTIIPDAAEKSARKTIQGIEHSEQEEASDDIGNCVVAAACTVPMLELYQHSCRELKNYISEDRKVAKEIEEATYEDNPLIFREYISAPSDVKHIMDNQFKNVKTNARLLSKAMWYEWRMKLLDGLKEGLMAIGEGMEEDSRSLTQQEQILLPFIPGLKEEHDKLEEQIQIAQTQAAELAGCDQQDLKEARDTLVSIDQDLKAKRAMLKELQDELREHENGLETTLARKEECAEELRGADKIRQGCRGWDHAEIATLQSQVDTLEASCGWTIASANGLVLTMTYNRTLQLLFRPASFLPKGSVVDINPSENAPISLSYIADTHGYQPQPLTTQKRFFLQIIRAQLQCLHQSQTKTTTLLAFVGGSWDIACSIAEEINALCVSYITEPTITADEEMVIRSTILLRAMRARIEVVFEVRVHGGEGVNVLGVSVKPKARVCYGETLNEKKMSEFLESRIHGVHGYGVWARATRELEERLIARGKKS
ncbi:MAG: hypothetical protein Q9163_002602 [Psora crenata]